MGRKKILIVGFKNLYSGKRVFRQINFLKDKYEVHTLGFEDAGVPGVISHKVIPLFRQITGIKKIFPAILFLASRFEEAYPLIYDYKLALSELQHIKFDLIICHDIKPLPLVYKIDSSATILCDAHEYYQGVGAISWTERLLLKRFDDYLVKKYFLKLKHIITVNEWIAEQYRHLTKANVDVITSAADYYSLSPSPVNEKNIRIIYHGVADERRKVELNIETASYLDERFQLDLMLVPASVNDPYYIRLKKMCEGRKNVRIIPPVDSANVIPFTNQYDIGLHMVPNTYPSHAHALPNKFFEFMQARLMIAIGPNYDMAQIVRENNLGIVSPDFEPKHMAKLLNSLTKEKVAYYKNNSHHSASEFSAEKEMQKLDKTISKLI